MIKREKMYYLPLQIEVCFIDTTYDCKHTERRICENKIKIPNHDFNHKIRTKQVVALWKLNKPIFNIREKVCVHICTFYVVQACNSGFRIHCFLRLYQE